MDNSPQFQESRELLNSFNKDCRELQILMVTCYDRYKGTNDFKSSFVSFKRFLISND